jgi:hypothetical protein
MHNDIDRPHLTHDVRRGRGHAQRAINDILVRISAYYLLFLPVNTHHASTTRILNNGSGIEFRDCGVQDRSKYRCLIAIQDKCAILNFGNL